MDEILKSNLGTLIPLSLICFGAGVYKGLSDAQGTTGDLEYVVFYAPACLGGYLGGSKLKKSKPTGIAYASTSFICTAVGLGIGYGIGYLIKGE